MVQFGAPGERRDDTAIDRDAAAAGRDLAAGGRDAAAADRDVQARDRDDRVGRNAEDLRDRLARMGRESFDRRAGRDDVTVDAVDWPELDPAALAHLHAYVAEQRLIDAADRAAVRSLTDDLHGEIEHGHSERQAAARDRRAAAADRQAAARDRASAEQDRADAARDRDQAAIERQQERPVDADLPPESEDAGGTRSLADRVAQAVAGSRRRISDSRAYLAGGPDGTPPAGPTPGG